MPDTPILDAPMLPPWLLAYAEYDGRYVWLKDQRGAGPDFPSFQVGAGLPGCPCPPGSSEENCPVGAEDDDPPYERSADYAPNWPHYIPEVYLGDDYNKAWAVFERERENLREEAE